MTARASLAMVKDVEAGAAVSYGRTWTADRATTLGLVPARVRRRRPARGRQPGRGLGRRRRAGRCAAGSAWTSSSSTWTAPTVEAGADAVLFGPGVHGEPTAQDWAEACGTISYEIVTRIGGRMTRRHVDSDAETEGTDR